MEGIQEESGEATLECEDTLVFFVNGRKIALKNPAQDKTLTQFLRNDLGLTGTKISCGEGACGACTVTLARPGKDGIIYSAINSCFVKICSLHGTSITTVEGLAPKDGQMHPIQERLHKGHGVQCGYCTPGMVMSMHSRLRDESCPVVDVEDVVQAIDGNLCRCTGYRPIVEALSTFCSNKKEAWESQTLDKSTLKDYCPKRDDPELPEELKDGGLFKDQFVCFVDHAKGTKWYRPTTLSELAKVQKNHETFRRFMGGTGGYKRNFNYNHPVTVQLDAIQDLMTFEETAHAWFFGSGVTLTEMSKIFGTILSEKETRGEGELSIAAAFAKALSTLASPQIRNVARIGGSVFYTHPCSDLIPLYIVCGLNYVAVKDAEESFRDQHYKAFCSIWGLELTSEMVDNSCGVIRDAVFSDVPVNDAAPGHLDILRKTLAVTFTNDFLKSLCDGSSGLQWCKTDAEKKFHQMFRKVGDEQPVYDLVERPVAHLWSDDLARGRGVYVDDMKPLKDELVAVLVQSKIAHGEIISIDFSEALKVPGVEGTVSASDLTPEQNAWGISWIQDEEVFASKKVYHHGQVVAALLCSDVNAGRLAAQKVVVQYKELPSVLGVREERQNGTDLDSLESFMGEFKVKRLQDENIIAAAGGDGQKTVSGTVTIGRQEHAYMETHAAIVVPVGEKNEFVCYYTTQEPTTVQVNMARVLGVPRHKIIVKTKRIGGGFGGKERLLPSLIAAVGSKKSGRPVRLVLTRREDMAITGHRHEILADYKVDFDEKSGKILNSNFAVYTNAGHAVDLSIPFINLLIFRLDGGYTLTNFEARGRALRTNVVASTAMRGFGGPEAQIIIEEIVDRIAHELKKDPKVIKEVNLTREGDQLHHGNQKVEDCTLQSCWKECLEKSNYDQRSREVQEFNAKNKRTKRGLAITPLKFAPSFFAGPLFQACALIRVYTDGSVLLSHGGIEMGQGLHTKMIQIASRMLEIDASKIHINETSTETVANTTPTGGSTGTDLNGVAVMNACKTIMSRLEPVKAFNPSGTWEEWITAAYFQRINLNAMGYYDSSKVDFNFFDLSGRSFDYLVYGAGAVEVEVDCHTGDISVLSAHLVMDVGRSLNPAIDVGQIEGAFLQGLGYVTNEQLINCVESGKLLTDNFGTYKLPTVRDIPNEISVTLLNREDVKQSSEVCSSKGIGEPPLMLCAAVTSAVRQAIAGYRKDQGLLDWFDLSFPLTADKVRMAAEDEAVLEAGKIIEKGPKKWAIEV